MSKSYTRSCKKCGRRIQLRKMPHGQWVAFEGYDAVHKCEKQPKKKIDSKKWANKPKKSNIFDIKMPEIHIGEIFRGIKEPKVSPKKITLERDQPPIPQTEVPRSKISGTAYNSEKIKQDNGNRHPKAVDDNGLGNLVKKYKLPILLSLAGAFLIIILVFIGISFIGVFVTRNGSNTSTTTTTVSSAINQVSETNTIKPTQAPSPTTRPSSAVSPQNTASSNSNNLIGCVEGYSSIGIRTCPGNETELAGYLMMDNCVEIVGRDAANIWVLLDKGGWVNSYYLSINTDIDDLPVTSCENK